MLEIALVLSIVLGAGLCLARRAWRALHPVAAQRAGNTGCGGCSGCGAIATSCPLSAKRRSRDHVATS